MALQLLQDLKALQSLPVLRGKRVRLHPLQGVPSDALEFVQTSGEDTT